MKINKLLLCILMLSALVSVGAAYSNGTYLKYAGSAQVNTFHNLVYNGTAYVQEGQNTRIYDLSPGVDLSKIRATSFVNQILTVNGQMAVDPSNNRLYIGKYIYDISDRINPVRIGNVSASGFPIPAGNLLYMLGSSITVFDVSNPTAPVRLSSIGSINGVRGTYDGRYIYSGSYSGQGTVSYNLVITDVQDPVNPIVVSRTDTGAEINGIAYYNNTVYTGRYLQALDAWDVTNRSAPVRIYRSTSDTGHDAAAMDVEAHGHYLYISTRYKVYDDMGLASGGMVVYDISSPIPRVVDSDGSGYLGYTEDISTDGNVAVISCNTLGFNIYDVKNKTSIKRKALVAVPSTPWTISATTMGTMDVLGYGGRDGGSWYWNVTDPTTISTSAPIASWNEKPLARIDINMPFQGNYSYVYMGTNGNGAWIVNLTGLEKPGFILPPARKYNPDDQTVNVFTTDDKIFVGSRFANSIRVFNNTLKDTAEPALISSGRQWGTFAPMYLYHDNYIIVPASGSLVIYGGIGPGENLIKAADFTYGRSVLTAYYDEDSEHVYTVESSHAVRAINVSDMNNIYWETGSVMPYMQPRDLAANGTDVFLVGRDLSGSGSVQMISFADMSKPRIVDHAVSPGGDDLAVEYYKGYLYTGGGSLTAWKVIPSNVPQPVTPTPSPTPTPTTTPTPTPTQVSSASIEVTAPSGGET